MNSHLKYLIEADKKAKILYQEIEKRGLVKEGKSEAQLKKEFVDLSFELFGVKKFWHKRIVRSGKNSLLAYHGNPPVLTLQKDDIVYFDFGPVFDEWEADLGRTYVIGNDINKLRLKNDIELAWNEGREFYNKHKYDLTGSDFYNYTKQLAKKYGWSYINNHCGHLIGKFPHEKLLGESKQNYLHPENYDLMSDKDKFGNERFWIYEIQFIDENLKIGGFFEQLLY
jgi:Xaa-Pro aminopeptidase